MRAAASAGPPAAATITRSARRDRAGCRQARSRAASAGTERVRSRREANIVRRRRRRAAAGSRASLSVYSAAGGAAGQQRQRDGQGDECVMRVHLRLPQSSRNPTGPIRPWPPRPERTLARWRQALPVGVGVDDALRIVRRHEARRSVPPVAVADGLDQIGRDDDDQLGLVALKLVRAEQLAEDRDVAEPGHSSRCSAWRCSAAARRARSSRRCRVRPWSRRGAPSAPGS